MALRIDYQSEGFPKSLTKLDGYHTLDTSWDDLLWAAITVGRPNRQFVFQHGQASFYEALFRLSLIRMALEQYGWGNVLRLKRTAAFRTLDPTEKGAVSYFLGLTLCKLFADKLLVAPWMLHLDVFGAALAAQLTSRSRPDLIGQTNTGEWLALECKGRVSPPDSAVKKKAKHQATRITHIAGVAPTYCIGGIAFFKGNALRFFWRDPEPPSRIRNPIRVPMNSEAWGHYYRPALELVRSDPAAFARMREQPIFTFVEEADIKIGIQPSVLDSLAEGEWDEARQSAIDSPGLAEGYHSDGIAVKAGPSWQDRFAQFEN